MFGDSISELIGSLYEAISDYPTRAIDYKQDLEEILASLNFLLLKIDNSDMDVDIQAYNVFLNHAPLQIDAAFFRKDPYEHQPKLAKYVTPKQPKWLQPSRKEQLDKSIENALKIISEYEKKIEK